MKIVINRCYGGYSLSKEAYEYLGLKWDGYGYAYDNDRTNPRLVECIEMLGNAANGRFAELEIVDIPDDIEWTIEYYDGIEEVHEVHNVWF